MHFRDMSKRSKDVGIQKDEAEAAEGAPEADAQSGEQEPAGEAGAETARQKAPEKDLRAELETLRAELNEREAEIAKCKAEIADYKDKYLRVLADSENARRRMRQQSEETIRLQRENLLRDLLPVIDNLERAVDAAQGGGNGNSIVEGVEMVLRSMLDLLRSQGVTQLSAVGRPFDPQLHEAVDQVESSDHVPNTVVAEFHRGYQIGDRVLRPARVTVAKAAAETKQDSTSPNNPSNGEDQGGKNGVENN
jgi:molecular chaperone GrpE